MDRATRAWLEYAKSPLRARIKCGKCRWSHAKPFDPLDEDPRDIIRDLNREASRHYRAAHPDDARRRVARLVPLDHLIVRRFRIDPAEGTVVVLLRPRSYDSPVWAHIPVRTDRRNLEDLSKRIRQGSSVIEIVWECRHPRRHLDPRKKTDPKPCPACRLRFRCYDGTMTPRAQVLCPKCMWGHAVPFDPRWPEDPRRVIRYLNRKALRHHRADHPNDAWQGPFREFRWECPYPERHLDPENPEEMTNPDPCPDCRFVLWNFLTATVSQAT
jgi:hypothetical protein